MTFDDMRFWGQGTWSDNTFCAWPQSKRQHPMKGDNCGFLGCYFNDDGINSMHDEFFAPMSAEVPAILNLAREEAPDMAVSLHSHHVAPVPVCPVYVPQEIKHDIKQLSVNYAKIMKRHNLPTWKFEYVYEKGKVPPTFNLVSALYHVSGAKSFHFECPHGIVHEDTPTFSMDDILEMQLGLYEAMMNYELNDGSK
ncbi:MAG: hypothetical protein A2Y10_09000 [Planctomycetes bacterium GWF2_41_51]|nr:MAG: hypothetical protein A2Y10_09000 [Planctomycetes bacterium GWF2_41_51]HBG26263.1 hypothetical protein [Phycisphaerales bacterium]